MSPKSPCLFGIVIFLASGWLVAQTPQPFVPPAPQVELPPAANVAAASVNGQVIPELAVYRSLQRVKPEQRDQARKEVISFLVDNMIIDQYLGQLKIQVEPKELDEQINKIKKEAEKDKQDFEKVLAKLNLTEADLKRELTGALRWDKFVLQQGTDKVLQDMFQKNIDMFNGSRVQARHILIGTKDADNALAVAKLAELKKQIETKVAQDLAKIPAGLGNLEKEQERIKALDKTFSEAAALESTCPSKKQGGDLGYFPRIGMMVEPFAKTAFALKTYEISDPVVSEFGVHLILAVDHKPGKDVKFEEVKPFVQEVYSDKLRDAVLAQYKPRCKIIIEESKK